MQKVPIKNGRKFRQGGSVMDTPSRDMRNPSYRKQLEKEQALETSTADLELLLGVGAAKKGIGFLAKNLKNFSQSAPSRSITKNIEIGSKTPEAIYKKEYDRLRRMADDALAEGRKVPEKEIKERAEYWTQYELKKIKDNKLPSRSDLVKDEAKQKALKAVRGATSAMSYELGPKALRKLTDSEEKPSPMRKGGLAQKRKQPIKAKITVKKKTVATKTKRAR